MKRSPARPARARHTASAARNTSEEIVDPRWLLKALGTVVVAALLCGYATFCLLFYQGQWQLVLHPTRTAEVPAAIDGTRPEVVHFGADASGLPQLAGWWIPASPESRFGRLVVLFLPREDQSLAGSVPALTALHRAGVSVFGIDFRGYGQSAATHPSEARMNEDADAAMAYLRDARHLTPEAVMPFGVGVSGAIAGRLAGALPAVPGLMLQDPEPAVADRVLHDPRVRLLPVGLLLRDRFVILPRLAELQTPKLIVTGTAAEDAALQSAGNPKITAVLQTGDADGLVPLLRRFLDQYAPASAGPGLIAPPARTP